MLWQLLTKIRLQMATKKDIGKVFKEHFKNFEQTPDPSIWTSIASELDTHARKKVVPLWYYFGSIVIGVVGSIWFFAQKPDQNTPQNSIILQTPHIVDENLIENDCIQETNSTNKLEEGASKTLTAQTKTYSISDAAVNSNLPTTKKVLTKVNNDEKNKSTATNQKNSTSPNQLASSTALTKESKNTFNNAPSPEQPEITVTTIKNLLKLEDEKRRAEHREALALNKANEIVKNQKGLNTQHAENTEVLTSQLTENQNQNQQTNKEAQDYDKDQTKEKSPKSEEEGVANIKEQIPFKISISPYTSIQSYGSLTQASSLDDRLVNNPRQSISTLGYGIKAEYSFTEKTRLRLGIGYSPLKYRTENFQVTNTNGNINIFELAAISGQALSQGANTTEGTPEAIEFFNNNPVISIQQNISYIEVPLDFQYMIVNKKVGLSVSPGVSLFILDDNSIVASADNGASILVGNDANLSSISLAFNVGLGAHYNFNPNWRFNLEPVFRYQLNPYNNSLSNFRPYYFGAQFGVSYKF